MARLRYEIDNDLGIHIMFLFRLDSTGSPDSISNCDDTEDGVDNVNVVVR
jgi:hypothetical protein